jgi:hypothetical protein
MDRNYAGVSMGEEKCMQNSGGEIYWKTFGTFGGPEDYYEHECYEIWI